MKEKVLFLCLLFVSCLTLTSWLNNKQESNNNNSYKEVVIGNQIWMAENLNVVTFSNGDTIPEAKTVKEWGASLRNRKPAWCYFNNDKSHDSTYGKIYNYYAINDQRGLAPKNWKIPSSDDWEVLFTALGGKRVAGAKLKSIKGWKHNGNGSNSSGFNALPSGSRGLAMITTNNGFSRNGSTCVWWSSTRIARSFEMIAYSLYFKSDKVSTFWETFASDGYAVRCIKN
jgi:uncharacterized protein (TIGR02145 family)